MSRTLLGLLVALLASSAQAGSLEAAPTTIELSPSQRTGVLHVVNRADHPIAFQVEAFDWNQDGAADDLAPSTVLQVSPPIAELAPGQKQTVRLRADGAPSQTEQAFRLLVSELPGPSADARQQVRILLQFSIPVFAPARQAGDPALTWEAQREGPDLVLVAANRGARRAKLTGLKVNAASGALAVPGGDLAYVLAGKARRWRVSAGAVPPTGTVTLQVGGEAEPPLLVPVRVKD